jgi:hypothetical protein
MDRWQRGALLQIATRDEVAVVVTFHVSDEARIATASVIRLR